MKEEQAEVYYRTGNDLLKKGNFLKAIESYKNAIRFNPTYFKAYCNIGVAYKNIGLYKEAEDVFRKALKLKPYSAVIYNNLGNVYSNMNRLEEAKWFYKKALVIHPRYKDARYNLGQVYHFVGEQKKAMESRIILEKMGSNPGRQNRF